jgi:hypothetical protein
VRELELSVGDVEQLELVGRGSAGYSWQTELEGPEGVLEVRHASSGPLPAAAAGGPPPSSGSLPEVLELEALRPGRVLVRLALRRSWEDGVPPLDEETVTVTVVE